MHFYCNCGIYDEDTSQQLEEGDEIEKLCYVDEDGNDHVMTGVRVIKITNGGATFQSSKNGKITIPIDDIIGWKS